jgi:hypothetical protein
MAIATININKERRKTQWKIIHHEYRTHQLSRIKDKGLTDISRVAEDEIPC